VFCSRRERSIEIRSRREQNTVNPGNPPGFFLFGGVLS
jgi:hypothetical protein